MDGLYYRPGKFFVVPKGLIADGVHLIREEVFCGWRYLPGYYEISMYGWPLQRLSIKDMDWNLVCCGFRDEAKVERNQKYYSWLESVSQLLLRYKSNPYWKGDLRKVSFLPLTKARADDESVFVNNGSINIPTDLGFSIVSHEASFPKSYSRKLLVALGVNPVDYKAVADKILIKHEESGCEEWTTLGPFSPKGPFMSIPDLVSHARFLYGFSQQHGHTISPEKVRGTLYLASGGTTCHKGHELYIDSKWTSLEVFKCNTAVHFLSSCYFSYSEPTWLEWLERYAGVNTFPRLVDSHLSPEFTQLIQQLDTKTFLDLTQAAWDIYDSVKPKHFMEELYSRRASKALSSEVCINEARWHFPPYITPL